MAVDIRVGDWIERLRGIEAGAAQVCVTSPPYWGLRDYGHPGQLGLERTPDEYVAKLVAAERNRVHLTMAASSSPLLEPTMSSRLFHFTCSHAALRIDTAGALMPQVPWRRLDESLLQHGEPMTGLWRAPAVVWLTDMESPNRDALGLTSYTLQCDRTEFRYAVDRVESVCSWLAFAEHWSADERYLNSLASAGGDPARWFVSSIPLQVVEKIDRRRMVA